MSFLAQRLWSDWQEEKINHGEHALMGALKVTQEELEEVRTALELLLKDGYPSDRFNFIRTWREEGLFFLGAVLFAKYNGNINPFWESFEIWTKSRKTVRHFHEYFNKFVSHERLTEIRCSKSMYVETILAHTGVPLSRLEPLSQLFQKMVEIYPVYLEDEELMEYLGEMIDLSRTLLGEKDDKEADNGKKIETTDDLLKKIPMPHRRMAQSHRHRYAEQWRPLYRFWEHHILERIYPHGSFKDLEPLEWHLQTNTEHLLSQISWSDYAASAKGRRSRSRTSYSPKPYWELDVRERNLSLIIPEQRIPFVSTSGSIHYVIPELNYRSEKLDAWDSGKFLTNLEDVKIPVTKWTGDISIQVTQERRTLKSLELLELSQGYLLFDEDGNQLKLPLTNSQLVYVILRSGLDFDADDAHEIKLSHNQFRLFEVNLETDGYMLIGDRLLGVESDKKNWGCTNENLVEGAFLEGHNVGDVVEIYRKMPDFHFRHPHAQSIASLVPLIINGTTVAYKVIKQTSLGDGSGDDFWVIQVENPDYWTGKVLDIRFGPDGEFSKRMIVLPGFKYSWCAALYTEKKAVRVKTLEFDLFDELIAAQYNFPMKTDHTAFKVELDDSPYKIKLLPPIIEIKFEDGTEVPRHILSDKLQNRKFVVSGNSIKNVRVYYRTEESNSKLLRTLKVEKNQKKYPLNFETDFDKGIKNLTLLLHYDDPACDFIPMELLTIYKKPCFLATPVHYFKDGNSGLELLPNAQNGTYTKISYISGLGFELFFSANPEEPDNLIQLPSQNGIVDHWVLLQKKPLSPGEHKVYLFQKHLGFGTEDRMQQVDETSFFIEDVSTQLDDTPDFKSFHLECIKYRSRRGTEHPIRNFRLEFSNSLPQGEAKGYFIHKGVRQEHFEFNPYTVKLLAHSESLFELEVVDRNGGRLKIDPTGRVNPLHSYEPLDSCVMIYAVKCGDL